MDRVNQCVHLSCQNRRGRREACEHKRARPQSIPFALGRKVPLCLASTNLRSGSPTSRIPVAPAQPASRSWRQTLPHGLWGLADRQRAGEVDRSARREGARHTGDSARHPRHQASRSKREAPSRVVMSMPASDHFARAALGAKGLTTAARSLRATRVVRGRPNDSGDLFPPASRWR